MVLVALKYGTPPLVPLPIPVPPCGTVTAALSVRIVAVAFGSVNVFVDVAGPEKAVNPFPVPPNAAPMIWVRAADPSKLFP
jgi:hypothetical protein